MKGALPVLLLLGSLSLLAGSRGRSSEDVMRCLPPGSKLEIPPVWTRLAPDAPEQVVLFYYYPKRQPPAKFNAVAVLQDSAAGLEKIWGIDCGGVYTGFFPDTGVYDINHTGRPKIVIDCAGFTTCPNLFGIYEYRNGRIEPVPSDFTPLQTCHVVLKDLGNGGGPEVIEYHHIPTWNLPEIYHWNGSRYARADSEFPSFWSAYAASVLLTKSTYLASHAVPAAWLAKNCSTASEVFRLAGHASKARRVCMSARTRLAKNKDVLRGRNQSTGESAGERRLALAEIDRILSKLP